MREPTDAEKIQRDANEHQIEEPTNAEADDYPQLDIRATAPMKCFVGGRLGSGHCFKPIDNSEPWIIVSSAGGAIFAHLRCLGMNLSGNYADPAYMQHIKQRLMMGLRDN